MKAGLLVGFGGPKDKDEIRPFLDSVLAGTSIPQERFNQVLKQYEAVGSASPYVPMVENIRSQIRSDIPVLTAYRHSKPFVKDVIQDLKDKKIDRVAAFVLSSFRSEASFGKYVHAIEEAKAQCGFGGLEVVYTEPFFRHNDFLGAVSENLQECLKAADRAYVIFTAHSLPEKMAKDSVYVQSFFRCAALAAEKSSLVDWGVAYQSRSGNLKDPWLGPDVRDVIEKLDTRQFRSVVLVPIGFVCDNAEIAYDLDIASREVCQKKSFSYFRARTVGQHPLFLHLLREQLCLI